MNLRTVSEVPEGTKLILRVDTDMPMDGGQILDNTRLVKSLETIKKLLEKKCRMIIIGSLGRPNGAEGDKSLKTAYLELMSLLESDGQDWVNSVFVDNVNNTPLIDQSLANNEIVFLENIRFWREEENNDQVFLQNIVELCSCFVMDAFAVAHRRQTSVMLCQRMPTFYGLSFVDEVNRILKIRETPDRPVVVILGGIKDDKLNYLDRLTKIADKILIGGRLPKAMESRGVVAVEGMVVAELNNSGLDLSEEDIHKFEEIIRTARTIIWVGAVGKYEDNGSRFGTEMVARAVAGSGAYKVIAGGDTGASLRAIGLDSQINFFCSGGGAMLELLTSGSLLGLNVIE